MGLFDRNRAGSTVETASTRGVGAPAEEGVGLGLGQMNEGKTTPANVPPASAVPDQPPVSRHVVPEPKAEAEARAQAAGLFYTVLKADVDQLRAKGHQPMHVEGPRTERPHKLFVYDLTPEKAKELLHG